MRWVSAIEAEGRFAELLDAVEMRGETFIVVRNGRPVARIGPASRESLAEHDATKLAVETQHQARRGA